MFEYKDNKEISIPAD